MTVCGETHAKGREAAINSNTARKSHCRFSQARRCREALAGVDELRRPTTSSSLSIRTAILSQAAATAAARK
jgi:hypothetical protein